MEIKITMLKNKLLLFLFALLFSAASAQPGTEYVFTFNKPGRENAGTFTTNGTLSLSFIFTADSNTDRNNSAQLFQFGNHSGSISYRDDNPTITYRVNGNTWDIVNYNAYEIITDGKPHKLTFAYDGVTASFIIGDTLIEERKLAAKFYPITAALYFGADPIVVDSTTNVSGRQVIVKRDTVAKDCLSGKISNVSLTAAVQIKTRSLPVYPLDTLDYPEGFDIVTGDMSKCRNAIQQFAVYPSAKMGTGNMPKSASSINFYYLAGSSNAQVRALIDTFCKKFNGVIRIDNLSQFYKNTSTYQGLIDLHIEHPEYQVDITTQLPQLGPLDGHIPLTSTQLAAVMPNAPNEYFLNERYILQKYAEKCKLYFASIRLHHENTEWLNFNDTVTYQNNDACRAAKIASGLTWKQYCSKRHAEIMNYVLGGLREVFPTAISNCYDVFYSSRTSANPLLEYNIFTNTDKRGSSSIYPQKPYFIKCGAGNQRGLFYLLDSRLKEISLGDTFCNPFIGAGWDPDPRKNLSPAQLSGLEVMMYGAGVHIPVPAYFTLTTRGATGIQNPAGYAFQAVQQAYIQAALSTRNVHDLYANSYLMPGDMQNEYYRKTNQPVTLNGFYWTGLKNVPCLVRRGTVRTNEYLIFTSVIKPTNQKDPLGKTRNVSIVLNGISIPLTSTMAGRIFLYDSSKPLQPDVYAPGANPKIVFSGRYKHPDRYVAVSK